MNAPASVVELLQALVRIPSVNPSGNPGCENPGEAACAAYVGEFLRRAGARVEFQEVFPNRPNVIGVFPSDRPGKKRLIFAPHTDTVSVLGMSIDPFSGEERDGRIWGRGSTDTKGTMAAILWTLWEMRDQLSSLEYEIWFVGLMSEETGQYGAKAFVKQYITEADADRTFALIGEPTAPAIVHTHKGSCWLTLTTRGRAVHASTPAAGENAIYKMMEVIRHLREEIGPRLAAIKDPVLGSPTFSVGTIQGGSKTNIVPDQCEVTVDIRTVPAQYEGKESLAETFLAELRTVCPDLEGSSRESFPLWTDPNHPLIALLESQGGKCGGAPWFCDAAIFSGAGVPAVAYGPGCITEAHTKDESLSIDLLKAGVESYRRFLQNLV